MGSLIYDAIVVGAGLSGCVCAHALRKDFDKVLLLERLDRVGGRTFSPNGLDLGAAWSWPSHDRNLGALIKDLDIDVIAQDVQGESFFETPDQQRVLMGENESPSGPGSIRLVGGTGQLCEKLVSKYNLDVKLSAHVESIVQDSDTVRIKVTQQEQIQACNPSEETFIAKAVVVAIPPKRVAGIDFQPALSTERQRAFESTQTWMGFAGKYCLVFGGIDKAFWRSKLRMNGTFFSRTGPIMQGWDNSDKATAALCGFVFDKHLPLLEDLHQQFQQRERSAISSPILDQLKRIYGQEVMNFETLTCKSWGSVDPTSSPSHRETTEYGDPRIRDAHGANVFFAGTESVPYENGHMEGAVIAGKRAAEQAASYLRSLQ